MASEGSSSWIVEATGRFSRIRVDPDGSVYTADLLEAAKHIAPVYDILFSPGMVASTLKADIANSTGGVEKYYTADPSRGEIVQKMIETEVAAHGVDRIRANKQSATVSLLWMTRAIMFNVRFVELLIDRRGDTSSECAKQAYAEILKPYHGFLVGGVVSVAMGMCPTRETLLASFGLHSEEEAQRTIREYVTALKRVLTPIIEFMNTRGWNFPDKA